MNRMMINWKTSLAGIGLIVTTILTTILPVLPPQYAAIVNGILAAIGLFAAKDNNVTGGTVHQ